MGKHAFTVAIMWVLSIQAPLHHVTYTASHYTGCRDHLVMYTARVAMPVCKSSSNGEMRVHSGDNVGTIDTGTTTMYDINSFTLCGVLGPAGDVRSQGGCACV